MWTSCLPACPYVNQLPACLSICEPAACLPVHMWTSFLPACPYVNQLPACISRYLWVYRFCPVLWIRIGFNADEDPDQVPTFFSMRLRIHEAKQKRIHVDLDPDPGQTSKSQNVEFLHTQYGYRSRTPNSMRIHADPDPQHSFSTTWAMSIDLIDLPAFQCCLSVRFLLCLHL